MKNLQLCHYLHHLLQKNRLFKKETIDVNDPLTVLVKILPSAVFNDNSPTSIDDSNGILLVLLFLFIKILLYPNDIIIF